MKELLIDLEDDIEQTKTYLARMEAFRNTDVFRDSHEYVREIINQQIIVEKNHIESSNHLLDYYKSL